MNRSLSKFREIREAERHLDLKKAIIDRLTKQKVIRQTVGQNLDSYERSIGGSSSQEIGTFGDSRVLNDRSKARTSEPLKHRSMLHWHNR